MIAMYLIGAMAMLSCLAIVLGDIYYEDPAREAPDTYHYLVGVGISFGSLGLPYAVLYWLWRILF